MCCRDLDVLFCLPLLPDARKRCEFTAAAQVGASDEFLSLMKSEMEKVKGGLRVVDQKLDSLKELVLSLSLRDNSANSANTNTNTSTTTPTNTNSSCCISSSNNNGIMKGAVAKAQPMSIDTCSWGVSQDRNGRQAPASGGAGGPVSAGGWGPPDGGRGIYPAHLLQQQQVQRVHSQVAYVSFMFLGNLCRSLEFTVTPAAFCLVILFLSVSY